MFESDSSMGLQLARKTDAWRRHLLVGLGCAVAWSLGPGARRHLPHSRLSTRLASVPACRPGLLLRSSLRQSVQQDSSALYFVTYPRGMAEAAIDEMQELGLKVCEHWESQGALTLKASNHQTPRLRCAKMVLRAARPPRRLPPELLGNICVNASSVYDAAVQVLAAMGTEEMASDELGRRINEVLPGASKLWSQKRTSGPTKKGLGLARFLEQDSRRQVVSHSCSDSSGEAGAGNTVCFSVAAGSRDDLASSARPSSLDAFAPLIADCASELKVLLEGKAWRATCIRSGDHPFRSLQIERCTADTLFRTCKEEDGNSHVGPVSLTYFEKEVVVCILHDLICVGTRDALEPGSSRAEHSEAPPWLPHVSAACVARIARLHCKSIAPGIVLDPMCGVGSNMIAVAMLDMFRPWKFVGRDINEISVLEAQMNCASLGLTASVEVGSSEDLPFDDNSVAMIVCEPPWGLRHLKHSDMKHSLKLWVLEWMRVLKQGCHAFIVTICTKRMESEVIPLVLQKFPGTVLERTWVYDNVGFKQCTCYMLRKGMSP